MLGFVISGLCAIQITVILSGPKNVLRYNGDFVLSGFAIPGFHCKQNIVIAVTSLKSEVTVNL